MTPLEKVVENLERIGLCNSDQCPICHSKKITEIDYPYTIKEDAISIAFQCDECKSKWDLIFSLSKIKIRVLMP